MSDTTAAAEEAQLRVLRQMTPARKLDLVADAWDAGRALALSGLRARQPEAAEEDCRRLLSELELGAELARRVYGELPPAARR